MAPGARPVEGRVEGQGVPLAFYGSGLAACPQGYPQAVHFVQRKFPIPATLPVFCSPSTLISSKHPMTNLSESVSHSRPIPNRLWQYRKRMGFTQRQVALILGYASPTDLSHYERGRKLPSLTTALKLGVVYRIPVEFLYHDLYVQLKEELRVKEERLRPEWDRHETKTPTA